MNWHHAIETYRGHTIPHFRFIEHRRWWFTISGVLIALSILGFAFRALNLSIDFEGGAQISYAWETPVSVGDVDEVLAENGRADANVQIANGDTVLIRTDSLTGDPDASAALLDALAEQAGIDRSEINVQDVGPTWGQEISRKAITGLIVVLAAISLYITIRFEWKMAIGAMVALVHDVVITVGVYALTGREVTPETVIAILTILGFSLYDTVVIYDKIKENTESTALVAREGYGGVVNLSLNQVFMRSVNTSLVVLLPILSLLLFGGETLKNFAFAMFVGVTTGAYSSIFIAAPVLTMLKGREARYRQLEARRTVRGTRTPSPTGDVPAEAAPTSSEGEAVSVAAAAPAPGSGWDGHTAVRVRTGPSEEQAEAPGEAPAEVTVELEEIKGLIREVADFPEPGINFKDITPVLADPIAFSTIIDLIVVHFGRGNVDKVVGIEARGFIIAAPVAYHFGAGFAPIRKKGKLPWRTAGEEYDLEYGSASLELHEDAVSPGERVLVVDDVLATGGTAAAAASLVERVGGEVCGIACLIELDFLSGRRKIEGHELFTLIHY